MISRLIGLVFFIAVLCVLFLFRFSLLRAAGEWLVVSDELQPSDAIILLSGDDVPGDRAAHAAALYKGGWAPVVVASGAAIRPYLSEADLESRDLASDGVPSRAIIEFRQGSLYTLQESRDLLKFCEGKHWTKVIVVTSNFHTRRARYIFRHIFPRFIEVRVSAAADSDFKPDGWWESRQGTKITARETAALCFTFWELRFAPDRRGF